MKHKSNLLALSTFSNGDFFLVLPFLDPNHSMASMIFIIFTSSFTLPKTTHLPGDHLVWAVQMKDWKPLGLDPAGAGDKMPVPECFRMKFSTLELSV